MTERTQSAARNYPMPFSRVEIAAMSIVDDRLQVLLARRREAPYAGKWALPGGVLRIDLDRSLDAAAIRVMNERLGVALPFLRQLCSVGGPSRDPRAPWALSVVYRALIPTSSVSPSAGKRIDALMWRPVEEAIEDSALAFDHAALIERAVGATRVEVDALELPVGFMPAEFTLGELQTTCERLLGRRLDKSSFRRRLADRDLVEPVTGTMKGGAFRPAQIYRAKR